MKRVITIQDVSAVGKCSATVALPIISAMGIECAVMPTAVLSTHTAFSSFTVHDLTGEMKPISDEWMKHKLSFDAIYTGYLASFEQIEIVSDFFDKFKSANNKIIVDPAMADNGVLYKGFGEDFPKQMAKICAKADLILPNLTEASFILGIPYKKEYDEAHIKKVLADLCKLGAKNAAITGVSFEKGKIGVMSYNSESGEYFSYFNEYLPVSFHGTGDIYSSVAVGAMMQGRSINDALSLAVDFTLESIRKTLADANPNWYGVNFEEAIPLLFK